MQVSRQDVEKVATLARLHVTEHEKAAFARQLSEILAHVEQLSRHDTSGVEPTASVMGQVNVFRDDVVRPSLPTEKALANAPEREGDGFGVPKILEER